VTQQFNTATSMGRLILNVLLSFAQFEREMISERTRDKIAATRRKGKWSGGMPLLGYDVVETKLVVNPDEAVWVRAIFQLYLVGKGEAALSLPVVARGSVPPIYHDASFSHGRPPPNCLQGGASINILSLPAVDHSDRSHQSDECDGSVF
jgi:site-specific DNA recombinase